MLLEFLLLIATCLSIFLILFTWKYDYWKKRGVPFEKPIFPFGSVKDGLTLKKTLCSIIDVLYYKYRDYKYFGGYFGRNPILFINDPELAKEVLVKHFNQFQDVTVDISEKSDPYAARNPFILKGKRWKTSRSYITPTFTSLKLKQMYANMTSVSKRFETYLQKHIDESKNSLEIKDVVTNFTTEIFAISGLNITSDSFENPKSSFKMIAHTMFESSNFWGYITWMLMIVDPTLSVLCRTRLITKEGSEYFRKAVADVLIHREKNKVIANDFFSYFHNLHLKNSDFTKDDVVSNIVTLFIDGVETTAASLRFALYEIARNEHVLKKLRNEIDSITSKYGDKITFDGLQEMTYMDCCIWEALRLNPVLLWTMRNCTADTFEFPPLKKGEPNLKIDKGVSVLIPYFSIHNDEKLYPDAKVYNPNRFFNEDTRALAKSNFYGFGDGPRMCIGMRYGSIVNKLAIATILTNFDIVVNEKTKERPRNVGPSFINIPDQEPMLDFYKRGEIYEN